MPNVRGNLATLVSSATAVTTSGTSSVLNLSSLMGGEPDAAQFMLNAATVSGTTPTLDVYLQWSSDAGTTWWDFLHFAQVTTTGKQSGLWTRRDNDGTGGTGVIANGDAVLAASKVIAAPINSSSFRVKWVISGTITAINFSVLACQDRD